MRTGLRATIALLTLVAVPSGYAQDMPDPSLIHGKAIPASELPVGSVTVRVVREAIGNDIAGQPVTLVVDGRSRTATTDANGRAEFGNLPPSGQLRAEATVEGERLVSDPFTVPSSGGLRIILVAGIAAAAERRRVEDEQARAAPPVSGVVVLGGETRIIAEFQGDALRVFYKLDIVNNARSRVDIGGPFSLDLPTGAGGAALLEGAPKSASLNGRHLTVTGPFDPGVTTIDLAFELHYSGAEHTLTQAWPVAVQGWVFGLERAAGASASSPQFQRTEERPSEGGSVFLVASGAPMPAGSELTLHFSQLPHQSRIAPAVAIAAALAIIGFGAWLSFAANRGGAETRAALETRRDSLLVKLEALERSRRAGSVSMEKYAGRRERLMKDLEYAYSELDGLGAAPDGGGRGVAA
jgi:hypothetical protein